MRPRPPDDEAVATGRVASSAVPVPASGLQLLGRFERSGHRDAPSLVRRADGQTIQLTPLLYTVLESIDGRRRFDQVAAIVGERTGRSVTQEDVRVLTEAKLRPLGLLQSLDGSEPQARKADPLLGLRLRIVVSNPRITRAIAAPFARLFYPPLVLAVATAFLMLTGWLLFERGLAPAVRDALYEPALLLLVFALTTLSAGFHELGHAAACTYGGGRPGAMGAGLYLVWPAFYTDVTDAYRLDRRARLRVDLGGIYFNALFALGAFGLWAATGWEALLAIIPLQVLQIVRQLVPLVRLDGYHILADLTGVPDLFAHIKPILAGLLPTRWGRSTNRALKPWVRVVVTIWVLVVVPLLAVMLVGMIVVLPRLAATAWDSLGLQWNDLTAAWSEGERAGAAVDLLAILALAVPILSMSYLVARVIRRLILRVWRGTEGRPARRAIAIVVAMSLLAALVAVWWPDGQYRPIEVGERGRLADVGVPTPSLFDQALISDSVEVAPSVVQQPSLALDSARDDAGISSVEGMATAAGDAPESLDPDSDFRFELPAPPGEGDNQALAVNYTDGSSVVAFALSLVLAGDDTVSNTNEAYALASCVRCLAAAIAFQLIVVLDEADVVVPENTAVAVSAYCMRCVTYALAYQLVVSLTEPLSDQTSQELDRIWSRLERLQANAADMSLAELNSSLEEIEADLLELLAAEDVTSSTDASGESTEDDQGVGTEASPSPSTEPSPTTSPSPTDSPSPSSEPSPSPSPSSEPSPTVEPSPTSSP